MRLDNGHEPHMTRRYTTNFTRAPAEASEWLELVREVYNLGFTTAREQDSRSKSTGVFGASEKAIHAATWRIHNAVQGRRWELRIAELEGEVARLKKELRKGGDGD